MTMTFWETVKSWFRTESESAREWSADVQRDMSAELDRKEAELRATPSERIDQLQDQIAGNTDAFDEIKGKIAAAGIDPEAVDDQDAGTPEVDDADIIDGDIIDGDIIDGDIIDGDIIDGDIIDEA